MQSQQATTPSGNHSRTSRALHEAREVATHPVESHPISTSLLVFGAGLGIGALVGSMIADASSPQTRLTQAEAVGRSVLDSLSAAVPDSLMRHMHKS